MRKGKQPHVQILARSTQLFDHPGEGISSMRFATRKKLMMSQETPSYDLPMPPERNYPIRSLSAIASWVLKPCSPP
jgi:hypothetical protein